MNILERANDIVNGRLEESARKYGPFDESIEKCAQIASLCSGENITPKMVFFTLIALKLSRESYSHKEDNLLDLVAYIAAYNNFLKNKMNNET